MRMAELDGLGAWSVFVDVNDAVVIEFEVIDTAGVETFTTAMRPDHAIELGNALIRQAEEANE